MTIHLVSPVAPVVAPDAVGVSGATVTWVESTKVNYFAILELKTKIVITYMMILFMPKLKGEPTTDTSGEEGGATTEEQEPSS
jgi:hypothetical protein